MHEHVHGAVRSSGTLLQFFQGIFNTDFMRRGDCVAWRPEIVWLHVISDAFIALSYYSIPIALLVFVRRRKDQLFNGIFLLFAGFILACGTTHVLSIIAFWQPMYRLDGVVKAGTGLISIITAAALWPLIPKAIALPSPALLSAKNHELELYSAALREARDELQDSHHELERRVAERTSELARINEELRVEIAARAHAEAELRISESRFKLALQAAPIVVWSQDRDLRITWLYNSRYGLKPEEVVGKQDGDLYDPACVERLYAIKQRVLSTRTGVRERVEVSRGGVIRIMELLIEPLHDADGSVSGITGVGLDVTEQAHAEQELAFQKYALDQHAIVAITDQKGTISYVNDKFCSISQYAPGELIGRDHRIVNSGFHPRTFFKQMYTSIAAGKVWRGEIRNRAKDGSIYWVDTTIVPLLDSHQRVTNYVAIRNDITSRKQTEESQRFLVAELDHRVKNNLSVVLSIAQETLRHSVTKEDFGPAFVGRIRAMARTHAALAAARWEGASLREILRITLEVHLIEGSDRVAISGPQLVLSHRAASVLSMTFNELATNATKYGSLSVASGRIQIDWNIERDDTGSRILALTWIESGGPAVQTPARRGLGSRFITDGVGYELDGAATLDFAPEGLRCTLSIPCETALADSVYADRAPSGEST